jgi:fructose-1,6-bisphosphatase II
MHNERTNRTPSLRHVGLDFVRVTEAAAIAASAWIGSGDKLSADRDATDAMRESLWRIDFAGVVAIGEGEKDGSYGLFKGDFVGHGYNWPGTEASYDLAVDPIDGTTPTVISGPEAMSVLAVGERGSMCSTEEHYMLKLAVGPKVASAFLDLHAPLAENLAQVAEALEKPLDKLTVCMLNRPRHENYIEEIRSLGARLKLIQDCDVSGAIATCREDSGVDAYFGVGGAPEGVITAAAIKCLGGTLLTQVWHDGEAYGPVLSEEALVRGPCAFAATGITSGSLLRGVRWTWRGPVTCSMFCRSESGTVRFMETEHGNKLISQKG